MNLCRIILVVVLCLTRLEVDAANEAKLSHEEMVAKLFHNCDMVFYCATTRIQGSDFDGTELYKNEKFMFSLKGGTLIVPKKHSVLGDGTANYKISMGGCSKETGKLMDGPFGEPWFVAKMFDDKWVEFDGGKMFGIDASGNSTRYKTGIWYAQCENFD